MSFSARIKHYFYDDESKRNYHLPMEAADWLWHNAIIERDEHGRITRIKYMVQDNDPFTHPLDDDDDGYWRLGTSSAWDSRERNAVYQEARGLDHDWNELLGDQDFVAYRHCIKLHLETGEAHYHGNFPTNDLDNIRDGVAHQYGEGRRIGGTLFHSAFVSKSALAAMGEDVNEYNDNMLEYLATYCGNELHESDAAGEVYDLIAYNLAGRTKDGYSYPLLRKGYARKIVSLLEAVENEIVNPHAFLLSVYDHGGRVYSLLGQGVNCRWDTAHGGAVLVPSDECIEAAKGVAGSDGRELMDVLRGWAVDVLDDYNAYLSGEVYGLVDVVYTYNDQDGQGEPHLDDRNEIDYDDHGSCWGFIGEKYAKGELGDFVGIY